MTVPWEIYGGSGPWICVEQGIIWTDDILLKTTPVAYPHTRKAHCVGQL